MCRIYNFGIALVRKKIITIKGILMLKIVDVALNLLLLILLFDNIFY